MKDLPAPLLALCLIGGVLVFLLVTQPPVTNCSVQIELFEKRVSESLGLDRRPRDERMSRIERHYQRCLQYNSPGGCANFFDELARLSHELRTVSEDCYRSLDKRVHEWLKKGVQLKVRSSWGREPPRHRHLKHGWLNSAHIASYCRLRGDLVYALGLEPFQRWQEQELLSLPGAESMTREDRWVLSLFSTSCSQ